MDKSLRSKVKRRRTALLAELGEVVTTWNSLENNVRDVVTRLLAAPEQQLLHAAGRSLEVKRAINRARILTTHMGNITLTDAIRVFAKDSHDPLRQHLEHLASLFDRLRELRNFYVHGSQGPGAEIGTDRSVEVAAFATSVSAKGSLTITSMRFGSPELKRFIAQMGEALNYAQHIIHEVLNPNSDFGPGPLGPLSSREKPPLPDKLLTSRQFLIGEAPPPRSSQA